MTVYRRATEHLTTLEHGFPWAVSASLILTIVLDATLTGSNRYIWVSILLVIITAACWTFVRVSNRARCLTDRVSSRTTNGALVTDPQGLIEWCNPAFESLTGYSFAEVRGLKPGSFLQCAQTDQATVQRIRDSLAHGQGFRERVLNKHKSGHLYWIEIDCQPLLDPNGKCAGFMAIESDVTHQVELEQKLRLAAEKAATSERFLAAVVDALEPHIAILDSDGVIIATNAAWRNFSTRNGGEDPVTGVGANYLAVCESAANCPDAFRIANLIRTVRAQRSSASLIYDCHSPTYKRWFKVSASCFQHEQSSYIVVVHQDVGDLIEIQHELGHSRERLELAINGANLGFWDWHIPSSATIFGGKWFSMLGYADNELSQTIDTWKALCHPEDLPKATAAIEECFATPGRMYRSEHRLRHKDGSYRWIMDLGQVVERDESGGVVRMAGVHIDVTKEVTAELEVREQKDLLGRVLELLPDAVFWKDREGRFKGANQSFINAVKCPSVDWLLGKTDLDLGCTDEQAKSFRENDAEVLAAGKSKLHQLEELTREDGSSIWIETSKVPLQAPDGRIEGVLGMFRDVSIQIGAMKALQEAEAAAKQASQTKSDFLANMSHEIRTPMNGVIGMTELLLDTQLNPSQHELADTVHKSAKTLLAVINDILDFSKIEARKFDLTPKPFDLHEMCNATKHLVAYRLEEREITLVTEIDPAVPHWVIGDRLRLQQVLANLLGNSSKFTPDGGAVVLQISVAKPAESSGDRSIRFVVSDTGVGIPENQQRAIFEPFRQADSSSTRAAGGTGLGLSISKSLVELMGGVLHVRSTPGVGSCFYFEVPLPASEAPTSDSLTTKPPQDLGDLKPLSVLLAEDNPVNRTLAIALLKKSGHHPVAVEDGALALEASTRERFDLILMDVQMPNLDGISAMKRIQQDCSNPNHQTPVIILTANAMVGAREEYIAAGAAGYVSKPIDRKRLLDTIHSVVKPLPADDLTA